MKKLLFVEDDPITGTVYQYHFTSAGYKVQLTGDAEKGLAALPLFKPDLVVLDLMLPRMDGIEFIKRVRSNPATSALPIVVFTNAYVSSMVAEAQKAGANKCLIKAQTNGEQLVAAIAQTLEQAAATPAPGPAKPPAAGAAAPAAKAPPLPDTRAEFLKQAPAALAGLRQNAQKLLKAEHESERAVIVLELYRTAHALTAAAALAQASLFAQMVSVLEAFLKDLDEKPKHLDASTMRTVNQAVDFLEVLFREPHSWDQKVVPEFQVLVVDDEAVSRKAVTMALDRGFLKAVEVESSLAAYEKLKREPVDLVITDINMPGMDGFVLCQKLRALPQHAKTPVIFVTALTGFAVRVRSAQSGGNDFIAKPFLGLELAVKALTQILRGKLKETSTPHAFQAFSPKAR